MIVCRQERAKSAGVRQLLGSILASVPNACTHTNIKVILRAVVRYVTLDTRLKCRILLPSGLRSMGNPLALASHSNFICFVITPRMASKQ